MRRRFSTDELLTQTFLNCYGNRKPGLYSRWRLHRQFSSLGPSSWPPVCRYIIFANVIVFLLQIFVTRPATIGDIQERRSRHHEHVVDAPMTNEHLDPEMDLEFAFDGQVPGMSISVVQQWLELDPVKVRQGQIWRIVTGAFCHDRFGIMHLLFNMLFIYWFGKTLELLYGSREFCLFYFAAVIFSSLVYILIAFRTHDLIPAIGASGAVMAIVLLYALHFPYERIHLYFLFPIENRWLVLIYVVYDVHPVLLALSGEMVYDGIAHSAHVGGILFGFGYWCFGWNFERVWDRLRLPNLQDFGARRTTDLNAVINRREKQSVDNVDDILRQISEKGIDSLSESQKRALEKASKQYRNP